MAQSEGRAPNVDSLREKAFYSRAILYACELLASSCALVPFYASSVALEFVVVLGAATCLSSASAMTIFYHGHYTAARHAASRTRRHLDGPSLPFAVSCAVATSAVLSAFAIDDIASLEVLGETKFLLFAVGSLLAALEAAAGATSAVLFFDECKPSKAIAQAQAFHPALAAGSLTFRAGVLYALYLPFKAEYGGEDPMRAMAVALNAMLLALAAGLLYATRLSNLAVDRVHTTDCMLMRAAAEAAEAKAKAGSSSLSARRSVASGKKNLNPEAQA